MEGVQSLRKHDAATNIQQDCILPCIQKFETVAERHHWSHQEKLTYLITALKGQTAEVLYDLPTSVTYEETLQNLEDRFEYQHSAAAFTVN
jgi:hypothetical protein